MKLLNERDGLALGICNGFQALIKLGLVPYGEIVGQTADSPTLTYQHDRTPYFQDGIHKSCNQQVPMACREQSLAEFIPIRHPTERDVLLQAKNGLTSSLQTDRLQHSTVTLTENVSMDEEWNVNGSYRAIEGITSPDGRVLGKMAHSERRADSVAINIYGEQDMKIFESGAEIFQIRREIWNKMLRMRRKCKIVDTNLQKREEVSRKKMKISCI